MEPDFEHRRVVIETIATLAHLKDAMAALILDPAGVPSNVYQPLLYQINPATGRPLSKGQMAPAFLMELVSIYNIEGLLGDHRNRGSLGQVSLGIR